MNWSAMSQVFKSENYLALVATVLITSQAPIFESIGSYQPTPTVSWLANPSTYAALFYFGLFISGLMLFVGRIAFDCFCPELIKSYPNATAYIERLPFHDLTTRANLLSVWETDDSQKKYLNIVRCFAFLFVASVVISIALGATSLLLFALR